MSRVRDTITGLFVRKDEAKLRPDTTVVEDSSRDERDVLLREVAASAAEFDDDRLGYLSVQIDRRTWNAIQKRWGPPK